MQNQMNSAELYLMIKAMYDGQQMRKAHEDTKRFGQEAKNANDGFKQAIKEHTAGFDNLRFAVGRAGLVYGATIGVAIALMAEANKKTMEAKKLSQELGISVAEASRQYMGIKISDEDVTQAKRLSQEWQTLKNNVSDVATKAGNFLIEKTNDAISGWKDLTTILKNYNAELEKANKQKSGFFGAMARSLDVMVTGYSNHPEAVAVRERADNKSRLEIDARHRAEEQSAKEAQDLAIRLDGQRKLFSMRQEMLRLSGREVEAFQEARDRELRMLGDYSEEVRTQYKELSDFKLEQMKREVWGFRSTIAEMRSMQQKFGQDTSRMFGDVFIDALDNKLANSRQIFSAFLTDLRNQMVRFLANQAVMSIFGMFGGFGGGTPSMGSGVGGQIGSASARSVPRFFASGGWAGLNGPETITVGEKGPEYIVPAGKSINTDMSGSKQNSGSGTNMTENTSHTYYYINAVDAASFANLVTRHPESIVAVTASAIQNNKSIRKTIKDFA